MRIISRRTNQKKPDYFNKSTPLSTDDTIRLLAFDNSLQANIITRIESGKIIIANNAACKLLGYSKKSILAKSWSTIFDINENSYKKMLKERAADGHSIGLLTAIKKNGMPIPCEITSAVFLDEDGIEKAITTIADMSENILKQKKIDLKKDKLVAGDIVIAKIKQKEIDTRKEKMVANNINLAKSRQKKIDSGKEKIVADNIIIAQAKSDSRLAGNAEWIKYISKTSYDVMWDWDIASGEIYVGDSIREVFGYLVKNNIVTYRDFTRCLVPLERDAVEKKLLKILAAPDKSWTDSYMFKRRDGSIAVATCHASILRNEEGKALRLVGAIKDVSRLQELEKNLVEQTAIKKENSEIFQLAAKLSYNGIWDWNLLTNESFLGEGFEELFGYPVKNTTGNMTDWGNYLYPEDREAVEKGLQYAITSGASQWEHAFRFIKADGSVTDVLGRASIIRRPDGKAYRMIGAIHGLSRQKDLEDKLVDEIAANAKQVTEYKESFKLIFNSLPDVIYDVDLLANEIILNDAFEKEFGYKVISKMTPLKDWSSHIHPDDREAVMHDYFRTLDSEDNAWKCRYRFFRSDGSVANILSSGVILRNTAGLACRMIVSMHDISKQIVLEERLEQEIKLKEKKIAEATEDAKYAERSDIGKELHDNINQLLSASRLYLELAKQGGEKTELYLSRSSEYTLTAIEEIRKLSKGLTSDIIKELGLSGAIYDVTRDMMEVTPIKIYCILEAFKEYSVNDKFKLNVFRIVQEQINNILKHAKATIAVINLSQDPDSIILTISDNGVGFDTGKKRNGIGVDNIISRAETYQGTANFVSQPGQGCILTVTFPVKDAPADTNRMAAVVKGPEWTPAMAEEIKSRKKIIL